MIAEGGADVSIAARSASGSSRPIQEAGGWLTDGGPGRRRAGLVRAAGRRVPRRHRRRGAAALLGIQYLESLKILEAFDLAELGHNSTEYLHLLLEAIKLASADRGRLRDGPVGAASRPARRRVRRPTRRALIDRGRAAPSEGERYLSNKDGQVAPATRSATAATTPPTSRSPTREGNIVAVTQSNGAAFGNGFVAGDTGIAHEQLPLLART